MPFMTADAIILKRLKISKGLYIMKSDAQKKAERAYKAKLKQVVIYFREDEAELLAALKEAAGETGLNAFVKDLIKGRLCNE